jgi:hypothetical protein
VSFVAMYSSENGPILQNEVVQKPFKQSFSATQDSLLTPRSA